MVPLRVLIVDDSAFARDCIKELISSDGAIQVVGEAGDGFEAIEKVVDLKPDIVTMDIEMPLMNGMDTIERLMHTRALPILVITSLQDARTAFEAVSRGALEVISKSDLMAQDAGDFCRRLKLLSRVKVLRHIRRPATPMTRTSAGQKKIVKEGLFQHSDEGSCSVLRSTVPDIIAIASSTGGPAALYSILSGMVGKLPCPVVVAQHIADGFDRGLAEWLDTASPFMSVKVSIQGEMLEPGIIYLAPSHGHMEIRPGGVVAVNPPSSGDIYVPSCDRLLGSVARVCGDKSIGIVLTGMGSDGRQGMEIIKSRGGLTIAQDETTSTIFGMPGVAIEAGCIDTVMSVQDIGRFLNRIV